MIRLAKKNGEYLLQERRYRVVRDSPAWQFWRNDYRIEWSDWQTAETIDLDEVEDDK